MKKHFNEIKTIAHRVLLEQFRLRRSIIFWIVFPTLMLLIFGLIYAGGGRTSSSFDTHGTRDSYRCGTVFLSVWADRYLSLSPKESAGRYVDCFFHRSAHHPIFLVFSSLIWVIAIGQAIIVYGIAFLFGGRFHGSLLLGILVVSLSVFSFVGMGFFFGAKLSKRTEDVNGPIAAFGVPLLVLGGTFFSTAILPPFLLKITYLNPIFHMNQALARVSALGEGVIEIRTHLIFLFAFTLVSLLLGIHSYRLMLTMEKKG